MTWYHLFHATFVSYPVHANDSEAHTYIQAHCGKKAAKAYYCFAAGATRADLYRFCRMYTQGGLYLDDDLMVMVPFEQVILSRNTPQ